MCYAGGPYCDKKYASQLGARQRELNENTGKQKVLEQVMEARMKGEDPNKIMVPSEFKEYRNILADAPAHSLSSHQWVLDEQVERAQGKRAAAERELYTKSPGGIETLEAKRLADEISNPESYNGISATFDNKMASTFNREKMKEYEMNNLREMGKKYLPADKASDPRQLNRFTYHVNGDTFEYSHPLVNDGEPFFTEAAKEQMTPEDLKKRGSKAGSERVVFRTKHSYDTGNMVSDGMGNVHIYTDIRGKDGARKISVTESDVARLKIRPTDAPGYTYSPYTSRATEWDNAHKSKNKAEAAKEWDEYKKPSDTPQERELRAKRFHTAYKAATARKKLLDQQEKSHQLLAEAERDLRVESISSKDFAKLENRERKKIEKLQADRNAAVMFSIETKKAWDSTPKGRAERHEKDGFEFEKLR